MRRILQDVAMSNEQKLAEVKAKAARYRALARNSNDDLTAHDIFALAAELEQQARGLERNAGRIRGRTRALPKVSRRSPPAGGGAN
jgi:hypothetical protein